MMIFSKKDWKAIRSVVILMSALTLFFIVGVEEWHGFKDYMERHRNDPPVQIFKTPPPPLVTAQPEPILTVIPAPGLSERLLKATAALYVEDHGTIRFNCTATMIQKTATGYIILTARHCVENHDHFFIMPNNLADAPYIRARLLVKGYKLDAALLAADTPLDLPVVPLGSDKLIYTGDPVLNVAMPHNIGKLLFHGFVAELDVETEILDPDWKGSLGLQLPAGGGSSGSAIVDPKQEAIIGVLTATLAAGGNVILTIATPVSKVRSMLDDYRNGKVHPEEKKPPIISLF